MTWHSPATAVCKCASLALLAVTVGFLSSCADEPPTEASSDSPTVQTDHVANPASLEITIDVKGKAGQTAREWLLTLVPSSGMFDTPGDKTTFRDELVKLTSGGTAIYEDLNPDTYGLIVREVQPGADLETLITTLTLEGTFTAAAPQGENTTLTQVSKDFATQICVEQTKGKSGSVELQPMTADGLTDMMMNGCLTLAEDENRKERLSPATKDTKQVQVSCDNGLSTDVINCSAYAMIELQSSFTSGLEECTDFSGQFQAGTLCGAVVAWGTASTASSPVTLTLPVGEEIHFETVTTGANNLQQSSSFVTTITSNTSEVSLFSTLLACKVFDRSNGDATGSPEMTGDVSADAADLYAVNDGPIGEVNEFGDVVFNLQELDEFSTDKEYFVRFSVANGDGADGTMVMQFDAPGGGTLSMNVDFEITADGQLCNLVSASGGAVNSGILVELFGSLNTEGDVLCTFVFTGIDAEIPGGDWKVKVTKGETDQSPNAAKDVSSTHEFTFSDQDDPELADGDECLNSPIITGGETRFGGIAG